MVPTCLDERIGNNHAQLAFQLKAASEWFVEDAVSGLISER